MPNENQDQTLLVDDQQEAGQETQPGTPPVTDVPEGQTTPEETPATPDSADVVSDAATDKKTPEQLAEDKAYFQREAQMAKAELRGLRERPSVTTAPEETPPVTKPSSQPDRGTPGELAGMTDTELAERLRDDPLLQMQLQEYRMEQHLEDLFSKFSAKQQYHSESEKTDRILRTFCEKNKISDEELKNSAANFHRLGIKGSPSAIGELIINDLNNVLRDRNVKTAQTDAAAKAAQAVKTQALTTQPTGALGAPAAPPKTIGEVIADKIVPTKESEELNRFFG